MQNLSSSSAEIERKQLIVYKPNGPEYVKTFFGKHLCLAKATVMDLPGDLTTTIAKFPGLMCIRALNTLVPGIHHSLVNRLGQ